MSGLVGFVLLCLVAQVSSQTYLRVASLSASFSTGSVTFQINTSSVSCNFGQVTAFSGYTLTKGAVIAVVGAKSNLTLTLDADLASGTYYSLWVVPATASRRRQLRGANASKLLFFKETQFPHPTLSSTKLLIRAINVVPGNENAPFGLVSSQGVNISFSPQLYDTTSGYQEIDAGKYTLSGCATPVSRNRTLQAGYVVTLYNFGGDGATLACDISTSAVSQIAAQISAIHAVPDAPQVTVTMGQAQATVSFGQQSSYALTLASTNTFSVAVNGQSIFAGPLALSPLGQFSLLAFGFAQSLQFVLLNDTLPENTTALRLMNVVPDAVGNYKAAITGTNYSSNFTLVFGKDLVVPLVAGSYTLQVFNGSTGRRSLLAENLVASASVNVASVGLTAALVEGTANNVKVTVSNPNVVPPSNSGDSGLSGGAIAGIVIASIFGAILIAGLIVYFYRRANYQSIP